VCLNEHILVDIVQDRRWPEKGIVINENEQFPSWAFDKDYIAKSSSLLSHCGSITTILHFLWYCGVKEVIGVGIGSDDVTLYHDGRIMDLGSNKKCDGVVKIIQNQSRYFKEFGIKCRYFDDEWI